MVLLVVDQFGLDAFQRYRPHYTAGLRRLLGEGLFYDHARYLHQDTATGPGHATLITGAYPEITGIVDNTFYDRAGRARISVLNDPAHPPLDTGKAGPLDDTSPRNLLAETFGDRLRAASGGKSKVVAVSFKPRSAILMAGLTGKAFWWSNATGTFTTSSAYMTELPAWLAGKNERRAADKLFGSKWEARIPPAQWLAPTPDDAPWEEEIWGLARTFPHPLTGGLEKPGIELYRAIFATPLGSGLILDAAQAALEGEGLAQDDAPDLLGVSLSAFDYTGHSFGPHSREIEESLVALDAQLGAFLEFLDRKAGKGQWLVAVTGDHGSGPVPEYMKSLGLPAGRMGTRVVVDAAEKNLAARLGAGPWIVATEYPTLYLDLARMETQRRIDPAAAQAACNGILALPGMLACFTRAQLVSGPPQSALEAAVRRSFHPERSGDIYPVAKPYWLWGEFADKPASTTHDSGWPYDAAVPLILAGAGVKPGTCAEPATLDTLAATLSAALGMVPPARASAARLPCR